MPDSATVFTAITIAARPYTYLYPHVRTLVKLNPKSRPVLILRLATPSAMPQKGFVAETAGRAYIFQGYGLSTDRPC